MQEVLQQSHENGISLMFCGILFYLSFFHFVLYQQHKKSFYLFYSLFSLLNGMAIFLYVKTPFFQLTSSFFIDSLSDTLKTYSFMCFALFSMKILEFDVEKPKFYKTNVIQIIIYIVITLVLFIIDIYFDKNWSSLFFNYIFFPVFSVVTIIAIPMILQSKSNVRYFLVIGIITLNLFAGIAFVLNVKYNVSIYNYLLYMGLLLENIMFSLALGYKQKEVFDTNTTIQSQYISELKKNEVLQEEVNTQLEEKVNVLNEKIKLQEQVEDLTLTTLRNQMNPHFMFNALNSIKLFIINNDAKKASYYLNKFSKLMRKILEVSRIKSTGLLEEIETIQLYMSIENIRFSNQIEFSILNPNHLDLSLIKVPPLILQPFVENAIWHGLASKTGCKVVSISIEKSTHNSININITDNGIGRAQASRIKAKKKLEKKSLGIEISNKRLQNFIKNKPYSISYVDLVSPTGTKVVINLPF